MGNCFVAVFKMPIKETPRFSNSNTVLTDANHESATTILPVPRQGSVSRRVVALPALGQPAIFLT